MDRSRAFPKPPHPICLIVEHARAWYSEAAA